MCIRDRCWVCLEPVVEALNSPAKHINKFMDKDHPHNKRADHDESIHSHKGKK